MTRILIVLIFWSFPTWAFQAGFGKSDITPYQFERYPDSKIRYKIGDTFYDTGVDGLFDYEEPGALGVDGAPGRKGLDDDGDGLVDNCDRQRCSEYLAKGSDDVWNPNRDNFIPFFNFSGTEGNGLFEFVHLGGFSPYIPISENRIANGILDPIWARAVVFEVNSQKLILVSTDLPGFSWKYINPLRREFSNRYGLPFENVIIASTHDHQAPDAAGYWTTLHPDHNLPFVRKVQSGVREAVASAFRELRPARWKVVTTEHYACTDRVTGEFKYLADCKLPNSDSEYEKQPDAFDPWIIQRDMRDPIVMNPMVVAVQVQDLSTSQTLGTLVNWHDHPETYTSSNNKISSDFPHFVRVSLEGTYGGTSVYFSGTVGCQIGALRDLGVPLWTEGNQEVWDSNGRRVLVHKGQEKVRSIGFEIADVVKRAFEREISWATPQNLKVVSKRIPVAVNNPVHQLATRSVWLDNVEFPDRLVKGTCTGTLGCVPVDMASIQLGDLSLVTSPGEMDPSYFYGRSSSSVDYPKKGIWHFPEQPGFGKHMTGPHRMVLGQANHYLSYLVHESDNVGFWNTQHPNHYEELVTVGKSFGDDAGDAIMEILGAWEKYTR